MSSCLAGKQPKGTFLIKGYSVRMAPHLRKDSKKESCFELTSQDRRSYEVGRAEEMAGPRWCWRSVPCRRASWGCYAGVCPFFVACSLLTRTFFLDVSSPLPCGALPPALVVTLILDTAFGWPPPPHPSPSQSLSVGESLVSRSARSSSSFIISDFTAFFPILFICSLVIFTSFHDIQKKKNLTAE